MQHLRRSGKIGALRQTEVSLAIPERDPAWRFTGAEFSIDANRWEVRDGEHALGIRFAYTTEFPAGWNTTEYLHLLRWADDQPVEVVRVPVEVDELQRGPGETFSQRGHLTLPPPEHHLVVTCRRGFESLLPLKRPLLYAGFFFER